MAVGEPRAVRAAGRLHTSKAKTLLVPKTAMPEVGEAESSQAVEVETPKVQEPGPPAAAENC